MQLLLTDSAQDDLNLVNRYLIKYQEDLPYALEFLTNMKLMILQHAKDGLMQRQKHFGYYRLQVAPFYVYYEKNETAIMVFSILHTRMDQPIQLARRGLAKKA